MTKSAFALAAVLTCGATLVLAASGARQSPAAQSPPALVPSPPVAALITQAATLSLALDLDGARARIDEAIALAEKSGDRLGLAMSYRMKGSMFTRLGLSRDAIPPHQRALAEFEALGNKAGMATALEGLAAASAALGDQAHVREFGGRAADLYRELGDERSLAWLQLTHAGSRGDGRFDDAEVLRIIEYARRTSDDPLLGGALKAKANEAFAKGDLVLAITTYDEAIAVLEKLPDLESLAAVYVSAGRAYRAHGDYNGALRHYQKAIDILAPTKERYTIVEATNASAIALAALNRHKEAIAMYERGLALARESGNQRLIDFMEGNLAGGLMGAGDYGRAIPALEAVIAKKPEPSILAFRQDALARALVEVGRAAEAVWLIDESIRYSRETKLVDSLADRLTTRSRVLSRLNRLDEALTDAREAISIDEGVRARLVPSDFLKRGYAEQLQADYRLVIDLLSRLNRGQEALEFAELGRARAFLDLLAARESDSTALTTRGDAGKPADGVRADLASESMGQPVNIAGIRRVASRLKSTVVTYWINEDATLIWIVGPSGEPVHVRVSISRDKLAQLVAATTAPLRESAKATTTRGTDTAAAHASPATDDELAALPMRGLGLLALSRDDKAAWRELYKTLIDPIRAQLPARGSRLTIVPHGPLFQLAFAALQNASGRYLLEDYELHYAPAISALEYTGRRQEAVAGNTGPWAVVGNPASLPLVGGRELPPLPGAGREVASISALAPKGAVLRLDRAHADEVELVRAIETTHPSVLHFATHGFVFSDQQQPPFLALNRRGSTDATDGRLTLDEVYGLKLDTDLVVLSACRSGSGQVSSDGVIGLTRGFFYAGSPSVLATFWDVVDEATSSLMAGFYRRYAKAHTKGPSLRSAQLALLADLRAGRVIVTAGGRKITLPEHPLLWAAFFLSGEP